MRTEPRGRGNGACNRAIGTKKKLGRKMGEGEGG